MNKIVLVLILMFLFAPSLLAQEPPASLTIGTVYVDSGFNDIIVPIYFTFTEDVCNICAPIQYSPYLPDIYFRRVIDNRLSDCFDVRFEWPMPDEIIIWITRDLSLPPDSIQGTHLASLVFGVYEYARPQTISITEYNDPRMGDCMFGLCDYMNDIDPEFTPGYIYYGQPQNSDYDSPHPPAGFSLSQNHPNPFSNTTKIEFELAESGRAKIEIFNICGQLVDIVVNDDLMAGKHLTDWFGSSSNGVPLPSGIYYYRLTSGDFSQIKKFVWMR